MSTPWYRKWNAAEVRIAGDEQAQRALRFACYHLIAAVNLTDEYVSISARGLFTDPLSARSLLMYRYRTLDAARRKAKEHGCEGALHAWESADTGDEATPRRAVMPDGRVVTILTGEREHHTSFIEHHNAHPKPFRWTKSADDILNSIERFCAYNLPTSA